MPEYENEFSTAFSTAYDAAADPVPPGTPAGVCYPPGADWSCSYTEEEIADMRADPLVASQMDRSEAFAWMTLAALTSDQVGTCPITVRPCLNGCSGSVNAYLTAPVGGGQFAGVLPGRSSFSPYVNGAGAWVNGCGCSTDDCSCAQLCEAVLPGPVGLITEVWLDGEVLPLSAYRVDNGNRLVRTDGECWPSCQDMTQGAHGEDAFSVTYYQGTPPNTMTMWAAGLLAAEFLKACQGKACKLPQGVRSITRQGISMDIVTDMFSEGGTGIREVDVLVARLNPYRLKSAPVIAAPGLRRARVTTFGRW